MQTSKRFLLIERVLNFLFPPQCAECDVSITQELGLCPQCWQNIAYIEKPICTRLGVPFSYDPGGEMLSAEALTNPPNYDRARYVAKYDNVARSLVQRLKFRDQTHLSDFMAKLMCNMGAELINDAELIIPVPLHRRRLFVRQYNQASLLANDISRRSLLPVDHNLLVRRLPTRSQIGLSAKERRKNVSGAFAIDKKSREKIRGKHILLVDDVVTTGSTIEACTRVLKSAGAECVNILGFARVTDQVRTL